MVQKQTVVVLKEIPPDRRGRALKALELALKVSDMIAGAYQEGDAERGDRLLDRLRRLAG